MSKISLINEDKSHSSIVFTNDGPITSGQIIELTRTYEIKKDFRAEASDVILVNTKESPITIYLPDEPNDGDHIRIIDGYNTFTINSLRLEGGDFNINGVNNVDYLSEGLIFDVSFSSSGWSTSVFYSGNYGESTPVISNLDLVYSGLYDKSVRMLRRYDYDSNGNYIVSGFAINYLYDDGNFHVLHVSGGVAHVQGIESINNSDSLVNVRRALDFSSVESEPLSFSSNQYYPLRWSPIKSISNITGIKETTKTITRGSYSGGSDLLDPSPVVEIVSVSQGGTTYIQGRIVGGTLTPSNAHYIQAGDYIDWQNSTQPAPGSTYTIVFRYQDDVDYIISNDLTSIYIENLAVGSVFNVSYDFYIPRIDRIILSREGVLQVVSGTSNALYPSTPPVINSLPLASLYLQYNQAPVISLDYLKVMNAADVQIMNKRLTNSEYNIARLGLLFDLTFKEPSSKFIGQFVDQFADTDLMDNGRRNDIEVINDQLELPVTWSTHTVRLGKNEYLDFSEEIAISQLSESTTHYLEPYLFTAPVPVPIPETFRATINQPGVTEGNSGRKTLVFTVALNKAPTVEPITVSYRTLETGTATPNEDFLPAAGVITFDIGQAYATIPIEIVGDLTDEADVETIDILLTGRKLFDEVTGTGNIIDDDDIGAPFRLVVSSPSAMEGDSGTTNISYVLLLNRAPNLVTGPLVVNYASVESGSATAGTDYISTAGSVTFAVGQTTASVSVSIRGDTVIEEDETFSLQFSFTNINGSTVTVTSIGTIRNDDIIPPLPPLSPLPATLRLTPSAYTQINGTSTIPETVTITASGEHYQIGETVTVLFRDIEVASTVAVSNILPGTTNPVGVFSILFNVPRNQAFGSVIVRSAGRTSGRTSQATFVATRTISGGIDSSPNGGFTGGFTPISPDRVWPWSVGSTPPSVGGSSIMFGGDPVAQTFVPSTNTTITSLEVKFTSKPIEFARAILCGTTVGFPDSAKILAVSDLVEPDQVIVDGWTKFSFEPSRVLASQEYAFILECKDKNVQVRSAKMGQWDRVGSKWITTQPYLAGVLLDSSTETTWISFQDEDLTFKTSHGIFTSRREVLLTTNGVTNPEVTNRGSLYRIDATNISDLLILALEDAPERTSILYEVTLDGRNEKYVISNRTPITFNRYTGTISVKAILTTLDQLYTPKLFGDVYVGLGDVSQYAMYTSRAFSTIADNTPAVTLKSFLSIHEPGASSISMQFMDLGVILKTDVWSLEGTTPNLWYYTGSALERCPENVYVGLDNGTEYVEYDKVSSVTDVEQWMWGDLNSLGKDTIYIYSTTDPDLKTVKVSAFYDMTRINTKQIGFDHIEVTYSADIEDRGMSQSQIRIIGSTSSPMDRPVAKDLRVVSMIA